jgi:hypothetical protein
MMCSSYLGSDLVAWHDHTTRGDFLPTRARRVSQAEEMVAEFLAMLAAAPPTPCKHKADWAANIRDQMVGSGDSIVVHHSVRAGILVFCLAMNRSPWRQCRCSDFLGTQRCFDLLRIGRAVQRWVGGTNSIATCITTPALTLMRCSRSRRHSGPAVPNSPSYSMLLILCLRRSGPNAAKQLPRGLHGDGYRQQSMFIRFSPCKKALFSHTGRAKIGAFARSSRDAQLANMPLPLSWSGPESGAQL